jgi:hypothetical protein
MRAIYYQASLKKRIFDVPKRKLLVEGSWSCTVQAAARQHEETVHDVGGAERACPTARPTSTDK